MKRKTISSATIIIGTCLVLGMLFLMAACASPTSTLTTTASPTSTLTTTASPTPSVSAMTYGPAWDQIVQKAKQEGQINAYGYGFTGTIGAAIANTFGKEYGIKINATSALSAQLKERVVTEKATGHLTADLMSCVGNVEAMMYNEGLLAEVQSKLPEMTATTQADWVCWPVGANGYILNMETSWWGILVNGNLVKPEDEPKSWLDLLDPKWDGKIVTSSIYLSGEFGRFWYGAPLLGIDPADYITKLAKNHPDIESTIFNAGDRLAKGDFALQFMGYNEYASQQVAAGIPLRLANTKEGLLTAPATSYAMVEDCPHPNATLVYINWACSAEGQRVLAEINELTANRAGCGSFDAPGVLPQPLPPLRYIPFSDEIQIVSFQTTGIARI